MPALSLTLRLHPRAADRRQRIDAPLIYESPPIERAWSEHGGVGGGCEKSDYSKRRSRAARRDTPRRQRERDDTNSGFTSLLYAIARGHREVALTLLRAGAAIKVLRAEWIKPDNKAPHNHMVDIIDEGGWNARVERHRRPLMSILSNLALPHDALVVVLSFWSPPGGR